MAWWSGAVLVLVMATSSLAMDDEMAELAKMLHDNCGEETGADLSYVDKVNAGTDLDTIKDQKFNCYIKCILETAGMMSNGEMDIEAVLAMLPADLKAKTESGIRSCGTKKGGDDCETAYLTQICWQQNGKENYFLI